MFHDHQISSSSSGFLLHSYGIFFRTWCFTKPWCPWHTVLRSPNVAHMSKTVCDQKTRIMSRDHNSCGIMLLACHLVLHLKSRSKLKVWVSMPQCKPKIEARASSRGDLKDTTTKKYFIHYGNLIYSNHNVFSKNILSASGKVTQVWSDLAMNLSQHGP